MAGPWERYQAQSQPQDQPQGPWSRYQQEGVNSPEIQAEARRRQESNIPGEAIDLTQSTIGDIGGFYPQMVAAGRAGIRAIARPFTGAEGSYGEDYARERGLVPEGDAESDRTRSDERVGAAAGSTSPQDRKGSGT